MPHRRDPVNRIAASICKVADRGSRLSIEGSISLPIAVRLRISRTVLATPLPCQCRFDTHLLTRLQIECVTLDVLDDVFIENLSLEALERAFQTLAIDYLNFSQRNSPLFLKWYRRFRVAVSPRFFYFPPQGLQ